MGHGSGWLVDGDVRPDRGDDDVAVKGDTLVPIRIGPADGRAGCRRPAATPAPCRRSPPLTITGVPSGSVPTATALTEPVVAGQRLPDRGAVGQPPHPHRAVARRR